MIIEQTTFRSLLAIAAGPTPAPIHVYKNTYFALAHIGSVIYLAIAEDGPKEIAPYVEYDRETTKWRLADPTKEELSKNPMVVKIPVAEVIDISGEVGKKIRSILTK